MRSCVLLCLATLATLASAAVFTGTVHRKNSGFWYLGKFCFDYSKKQDSNVGTMQFTLTTSKQDIPEAQGLEILLYDDEEGSWDAVYGKHLTCDEWREKAKNYLNQSQDVDPRYKVVWGGADNTSWTQKTNLHQGVRPRFWYVVLSSCDQDGSAYVEYNVHFLNVLHSSWDEEFGMNEMGEQTIYLIFWIIYTGFVILQAIACVMFYRNQKYIHPLIKFFMASVALQFIYCFVKLIHYVKYVRDGQGVPAADIAGDVIEIIARATFVFILMLLASGWTISREGRGIEGRWAILILLPLLFLAWLIILIYSYVAVAPELVNPPSDVVNLQYFLLACWFLLAAWFIARCFFAWRAEDNPVKKRLFGRMGIVYGIWFLGLPTVVTFSLLLDPWVREKIVVSFDIVITLIGYICGAFLLWPSRAEEYFAIEKPNVMAGVIQHYEPL